MTASTLIVVPCFNEEARLNVAAFETCLAREAEIGFVFVDDGSHDGTRSVLDRVAERSARVNVLSLERNSGKAEAVRRGILEALRLTPRLVGYWDADLATPLRAVDDFRILMNEDPEAELVMGARVQLLGRTIRRSYARHIIGRVFATLASRTLRLPVYDTQCGAKLLRVTDRTAQLFERPFSTRWIFDVELIARLISARAAEGEADHGIRELPLREWMDVKGSKLRLTDGIVAFAELGTIRRRYPARSVSVIGSVAEPGARTQDTVWL